MMKPLRHILLIGLLAALLATCAHKNQSAPENTTAIDDGDYVIYTGPPGRTTDLDSVDDLTGQVRKKRPPDNLTLEFAVVDADSCRVIINLHLTPDKIVRHVADGIYERGLHTITWNTLSKDKSPLPENVYFYMFYNCGKITTKRLNYRTGDFGTLK